MDIKNVFIGGQSQGAIIACKLASEHPELMRGFFVHNGRLPVVFNPVNSDTFSTLHGLILKGKYDMGLPPKYAKSIVKKFKNLGVNIDSISPSSIPYISGSCKKANTFFLSPLISAVWFDVGLISTLYFLLASALSLLSPIKSISRAVLPRPGFFFRRSFITASSI